MSLSEAKKTTIPEETFVTIDGKEYVFNIFWIDKMKSVDTEITKDYIKSLLKYIGIQDPNKTPIDISRLLCKDYYNKRVFNSNGGIRICQFDYEGNLTEEFTSLEELMEITSAKDYLFTLKRNDGSVFIPKRHKVDFFGTQITPMYTEKSWRYSDISFLNFWMQDLVKFGDEERRSKVCCENSVCETERKYYSLEEYVSTEKMSFLFSLGELLHHGYFNRFKLKNKERKENFQEEGYTNQLNKLLKRYTHNGISLFQKVENLNDFKSQIGIYVFCLPEVKGYYVGKTMNSLEKRITNHWISPKSDFDRYYGHCDVKDVYVMCCKGLDSDTINEIETDCIATIGRFFSLNVMAGQDYIISIHNEKYDESKFSVSVERLREIKDGLLDIKF